METSRKKTTGKKTSKGSSKRKNSTKMEKAVYVMERMFFRDQKERKAILPVLLKECRLSRAGASTYYQTLKNRILEDES